MGNPDPGTESSSRFDGVGTVTPAIDRRLFEQLMRGCGESHELIDRLGVTAWPDWGTLLGILRHRNIIPWDYDADYCMLDTDYRALCAAFEAQGGTIGGLTLRRDYYGEPDACCTLLFTDLPCGVHFHVHLHGSGSSLDRL